MARSNFIKIKTGYPYSVTVEKEWTGKLPFSLSGKKVCFVTDETVAALYLNKVKKGVENAVVFVVKQGETSKSAENYLSLLSFLAENGFQRKDVLIALGGGVVGDLTGFAASTYMRGIGWYLIPTTLLSMIDSSVGGKTGIDFAGKKNLLGTFYQPCGVVTCTEFLKSLPPEEILNGKGELVKYAFLDKRIKASDLNGEITPELLLRALKIKAKIVEKDEHDNRKRMLLNFGHTVGHAIESLSGFRIPHGVCVLKGMTAAVDVSAALYGFSDQKKEEMLSLIRSVYPDANVPYKKEEIVKQILSDKKMSGDVVRFVTVKEIGKCAVVPLSLKKLEELL